MTALNSAGMDTVGGGTPSIGPSAAQTSILPANSMQILAAILIQLRILNSRIGNAFNQTDSDYALSGSTVVSDLSLLT